MSTRDTLAGVPIAPGLAMGPVSVVGDILECRGPGLRVDRRADPDAWKHIQQAFAAARTELMDSVGAVEQQLGASLADVFRAHALMLDNLLASGEIEAELRNDGVDAGGAVRRVFRRWTERFEALPNPTLQARADDVADLGRRVLRHLEHDVPHQLGTVPVGAVVVTKRLLPSDVLALTTRGIGAMLVESLGQASHAALIAREKSIPTIAIAGVLEKLHDGDEVLVDAYRGEVVVDADADTRAEFGRRVAQFSDSVSRCRGRCHTPAHTLDGTLITVEANAGMRRDVEIAVDSGADGVGLFRIEQLYLARDLPPTEDELVAGLCDVVAPLGDKPLTVRLLDVGGDKPLPYLRPPLEANPSLGVRGVRLLLGHPALLRTQLAALVRLSRDYDVRVLVPMITLEEDVAATRALFDETCAALGVTVRPPFGAMIETPAAALAIPAIARHVDFLSVGSNDLTQYTFAAGRDDPNVNGYFQDGHAALLRLLQIIVADAGSLPITLCGELAGRDDLLPTLLATGFRAFSVAPPLIPTIKERVRELRIDAPAASATA